MIINSTYDIYISILISREKKAAKKIFEMNIYEVKGLYGDYYRPRLPIPPIRKKTILH